MYSFGATGRYELFGLGNLPYETTPTPTPITSIGSVRALSASSTIAAALLEKGPGPPSVFTATPIQLGLEVSWDLPSSTYRIRYRPVGTREFSPPEEASCHAPCELELSGLRPEPYEVTLKTPEGREGREKIRKLERTPLPATGAPVNTSAPRCPARPPPKREHPGGPDAVDRTRGSWTNKPTSFTYAWLRCNGLGENGVSEEEGTECEPITSGPGETPVTSSTYVPGPSAGRRQDDHRPRARHQRARLERSASSEPELVLQAGEESEPPPPQFIAPPTVTGVAVGRPSADRPPRHLGRRTDQLRREVVPLQRP